VKDVGVVVGNGIVLSFDWMLEGHVKVHHLLQVILHASLELELVEHDLVTVPLASY